jgi:hypothetical protein
MAAEIVYWDSDCFLGWLQEEPGKVELCQGTLDRADAGEAVIVTSALTIAEVLWLRSGPPIPKQRADLVRRFFPAVLLQGSERHPSNRRDGTRFGLGPRDSAEGRHSCGNRTGRERGRSGNI